MLNAAILQVELKGRPAQNLKGALPLIEQYM